MEVSESDFAALLLFLITILLDPLVTRFCDIALLATWKENNKQDKTTTITITGKKYTMITKGKLATSGEANAIEKKKKKSENRNNR